MRKLPIQKITPRLYETVADQLESVFYEILFRPIVKDLKRSVPGIAVSAEQVRNASNPVSEAIRLGKIQYEDGIFSGQFSAVISRALRALGATFDKRAKVYRLNPARVPSWVSAEAGVAKERARVTHDTISKTLSDVQKNLDSLIEKHKVDSSKTIKHMEDGFRTVADKLRIAPTLSTVSKKKLTADYNDDMKLWIKKWSEEMISDLRGVVEENALEGFRFDKLISKIQDRYSVTKSKAKFLARQETGLFMSKFRRERFSEAGVRKYEWSAAMDERTRDDHRTLNGRLFFYSDPPITDHATGAKNNPGEDYNCRCVDIPILEELEKEAA